MNWWMKICVSEFMITRRLTLWCSRQPSSCRWRSPCLAFDVSMTTSTFSNIAHHWLLPAKTSQQAPITTRNLDTSTHRSKFVLQESKFLFFMYTVIAFMCPAGDSGPVPGPAEGCRYHERQWDNEKFKVRSSRHICVSSVLKCKHQV